MNKGFSLVELIVVIAIMAILVGVAVPVYTSYIGKANDSVDVNAIDNLEYACKVVNVEFNCDITFSEVAGTGGAADTVVATIDNDETDAIARLAEILGDAATKTPGADSTTFAIEVNTLPSADTDDAIVLPSTIAARS